jgi:SAM-dependent methyltransferase
MVPDAHNRRIVDQFTRWAKTFGELPIHAEAEAMARTIAACAVTSDMNVLDVACGPGILACALAEQAGHVTGIDITPAMIGEARMRQDDMALDNLSWQIGDATDLPFEDGRFDRVVTRYSFHHMTDPAATLAEMVRVCRPDGRIVVIDATPAPEAQEAYDWMERLRDPSHTSALTLDRLRGVGADAGLSELLIDGHRLEARLDTLSDPETLSDLIAMFEADIDSGEDRIGVDARRAEDGIRFHFPISIIAWER